MPTAVTCAASGSGAPITRSSRSPSGGRSSSCTCGSGAARLRPSHDQPPPVDRRRLFKYAVIDELVATNPTALVTRPRVPWEGQRRTVLHLLEFAAVLSAARRHSDIAHALVALLGMLGLRVSEACNAQLQSRATPAATSCGAWSARAPSLPRSRCPSRCSAQ